MEDYSKTIITNISTIDVKILKQVYQWIIECSESISGQRELTFSAFYRLGGIDCSKENFDAFLAEIFGHEDFHLTRIRFSYYGEPFVSFAISNDYSQGMRVIKIVISCGEKSDLLRIYEFIENKLKEEGILAPLTPTKTRPTPVISATPVTNITNVSGDVITITGSNINESALGRSNTISRTSDNVERKAGFWKGVSQQIVANIIWWVIGLIITAVAAYFAFI